MITPKIAIDEVRKLINVTSVKSLTSNIYAGEVAQSEYNRAGQCKEKFIIINALTISFNQIQDGIININIYAPNLINGVADYETLDIILLVVKPLIEDAYTNIISTTFNSADLIKEESINYSFYNIRIRVNGYNLDQNKNIKI